MKTLDELEAEQAKARAKLEGELRLSRLPAVCPDFVLLSWSKRSRPDWIVYRGRTLPEALALASTFAEVVPCYTHRGTFCEIAPDGCADPESEIADGPFAAYMRVEQGGTFGPRVKLSWFAALHDPELAPQKRLVRVTVEIEGPDYIGGFSALAASIRPITERRGHREVVTGYQRTPNQLLASLSDSRIAWGANDGKSLDFSYHFQADTEESGPWEDNEHAIAQLRNLIDSLEDKES